MSHQFNRRAGVRFPWTFLCDINTLKQQQIPNHHTTNDSETAIIWARKAITWDYEKQTTLLFPGVHVVGGRCFRIGPNQLPDWLTQASRPTAIFFYLCKPTGFHMNPRRKRSFFEPRSLFLPLFKTCHVLDHRVWEIHCGSIGNSHWSSKEENNKNRGQGTRRRTGRLMFTI